MHVYTKLFYGNSIYTCVETTIENTNPNVSFLCVFRLGGCGKWSVQQVSREPEAEETDRLWCTGVHCFVWEHFGGKGSR